MLIPVVDRAGQVSCGCAWPGVPVLKTVTSTLRVSVGVELPSYSVTKPVSSARLEATVERTGTWIVTIRPIATSVVTVVAMARIERRRT